MKTNNYQIPTRFARPTRFPVPVPVGPPTRAGIGELEHLKEQLLRQLLERTEAAWLHEPLRRAANDAAAIAWTTPCPLLVLPLLLEERAQAAREHARRQREVLQRSRALVLETV